VYELYKEEIPAGERSVVPFLSNGNGYQGNSDTPTKPEC